MNKLRRLCLGFVSSELVAEKRHRIDDDVRRRLSSTHEGRGTLVYQRKRSVGRGLLVDRNSPTQSPSRELTYGYLRYP
jgi:hypothetical protein